MLKKIDLPPLKRFKQIEKQLPLPRFERKL